MTHILNSTNEKVINKNNHSKRKLIKTLNFDIWQWNVMINIQLTLILSWKDIKSDSLPSFAFTSFLWVLYQFSYQFLVKQNSVIVDWFSRFYLLFFAGVLFSLIEDKLRSLYLMWLLTNDFSSFWFDLWCSLFADLRLLLERFTDLFQLLSSYFKAPPSNRLLLILDDVSREYDRLLPETEFFLSSFYIFML